jgi:hypothetical protein
MPRISEFFGVLIAMYHNDRNPPHFHAEYAEHEASFSINTLEVLEGELPGTRASARRRMGVASSCRTPRELGTRPSPTAVTTD